MVKRILILFLCLYSLSMSAQAPYTFECITNGGLTGDSCDVCPSTIIYSRSFNGLLIYQDSVPWKWIDQPYSVRVKPGGIVEYWEHGANPYSERVTVPFELTNFFTTVGMADSTFCNGTTPPDRRPLFAASDSINVGLIHRNDTLTIVGWEPIYVVFDPLLNKYVISIDTTGFTGGGSGSSLWTDAGAYTYLTSPTDRGLVGSTTELNTAYRWQVKDGLYVQGAGSTNATNSAEFHNSSGGNTLILQDDGDVGINTTNPTSKLHVVSGGSGTGGTVGAFFTGTFTGASGTIRGVSNDFTFNPSSNQSGTFQAVANLVRVNGSNTKDLVQSQNNTVDISGTGAIDNLYTIRNDISSNNGGSIGSQYGMLNTMFNTNAQANGSHYGVYNDMGGNASSMYGMFATITTSGGYTPTNAYGIYLSTINGSTNRFAIYSTDASAKTYLNGSTGIGTNNPQRKLEVSGEVRITDLVTDAPTGVVGADSDGDLGLLGLSGISVISGTLTATDGSITNEGILGVGAGSGTSSVLLSNTSTSVGVTINAAGILAISESTSANGGSITLTATEVDGLTTNEGALTVLAGLTTNALIHSNTSGSTDVTIAQGSGILVTENTGTGTITIASTAVAPTVTAANNGLSLSGTTVQWGGPLIQNTTIDGQTFYDLHKDGRHVFQRYESNPVASANVTAAFDISGIAASPLVVSTPAEDAVLNVRSYDNGASTYNQNMLSVGNYATAALGSWVKTRDEDAYNTYYPINFNPNGGKIGFGRNPASNALDAYVTMDAGTLTGSAVSGSVLHIEESEGNAKAVMSFGVGTDVLDGEVGYFDGANATRLTNRNTANSSSVRFAVGGETSDRVIITPIGTGIGSTATTNILSTLQVEGSVGLQISTPGGGLTLTEAHCVVIKTGGGAPVTYTLPDPDLVAGRYYWIMNHTSQTINLSRNVTKATGGSTFNTVLAGETAMIIAAPGNGWRGFKQTSL